tara:strand:- start:23453 stop:23914 length:462 start_codon:yes stop_codon:yes gene_type:complete
MRTVRVYSTSFGSGIQEVQVADDATWEDLKAKIGISGPNWTGVGRPTKTTYVSAEGTSGSSLLNKDDIQINIFPKQMKAGIVTNTGDLSDSMRKLETMERKVEELRQTINAFVDALDGAEVQINSMIYDVDNVPKTSNRVSNDDNFERDLGLS